MVIVKGPPVVGEENYGNGRGQQVKTLCGRTNHTLDYIGLARSSVGIKQRQVDKYQKNTAKSKGRRQKM